MISHVCLCCCFARAFTSLCPPGDPGASRSPCAGTLGEAQSSSSEKDVVVVVVVVAGDHNELANQCGARDLKCSYVDRHDVFVYCLAAIYRGDFK